MNRNRSILILFAILLLALALRLVSLGDHSLWYDEAFSVLFAQNDLATMLSGTVNAVEHPLLYYLTLSGWMQMLGSSTFAVRLLSVVTGVLTVGAVYWVARDLFDPRTGLAAAFITTIAPFHVQYSQEARMYSLLALLLLLATYCFLRGYPQLRTEDDPGAGAWGWWVGFGVLAGLAMHTQQLAAFYLMALGLIPLIRREWEMFARVVGSAGIAVVVFLPWLVNLPAQVQQLNASYWIEQPSVASLLLAVRVFFGGGLEVAPTPSLLLFAGSLILLLLLVFQIAMEVRRPRFRQERAPVLTVLWLFAAPIALMWLFSQIVPIFLNRALIASALMGYVLLAWLFVRSAMPRPLKAMLSGIGIVLVGIGLFAQYQLNTFPYVPTRQAMATINAQAEPGDVIIHMNKLTVLPAVVYAPQLEQRFIADPQGSPQDTLDPSTQAVLGVAERGCLAAAAAGAERIWFVTLQRSEDEIAEASSPLMQETFAWLGQYYKAGEPLRFNDLNVYPYAQPADEIPTNCAP